MYRSMPLLTDDGRDFRLSKEPLNTPIDGGFFGDDYNNFDIGYLLKEVSDVVGKAIHALSRVVAVGGPVVLAGALAWGAVQNGVFQGF